MYGASGLASLTVKVSGLNARDGLFLLVQALVLISDNSELGLVKIFVVLKARFLRIGE